MPFSKLQTRFAASKLPRYLHHTLTAVDHHLHCLAFVLLRIHRVLPLFCFHRVLFLSLSSRVRQIGGGSNCSILCFPTRTDIDCTVGSNVIYYTPFLKN